MAAWFLLALALPVDHVAASVDGHVIWESAVDDRMRVSQVSRDDALAGIVADQLLLAEANRRHVEVDDAMVASALDDVKTQYQLDDAAFDRALVAYGETLDDYSSELREQLAEQLLITETGEPRDQLVGELRAHARVAFAPMLAVAPTAGLHGEIAAFVITGGAASQRAAAADATAVLVGTALDRHRLRQALDVVMVDQTLADATVTATQLGGGVRIAIALASQPTLAGVVIREVGGAPLPVPAELTALVGGPLSPPAFDDECDRLRDLYHERSYLQARATWHTVANGRAVNAIVEVAPGDQVRFGEIQLHGNRDLAGTDLVHAIAADLQRGEPWNEDRVKRAELRLASYYWDHGYAMARVDAEAAAASGESPIGFTIHEGTRFHLGTVDATGLGLVAFADLARLGVRPGMAFSRKAIIDAGVQLASIASAQLGHAADVLPVTRVDTATATIDLTFEIR